MDEPTYIESYITQIVLSDEQLNLYMKCIYPMCTLDESIHYIEINGDEFKCTGLKFHTDILYDDEIDEAIENGNITFTNNNKIITIQQEGEKFATEQDRSDGSRFGGKLENIMKIIIEYLKKHDEYPVYVNYGVRYKS